MKLAVTFLGLLGLFIAPGFADYSYGIGNDNQASGNARQSVSYNNDNNVANVDNNNGMNSWNTIWDYRNNFAATRLFAKKSCIVHKMNKDVMPSIQALDALVKENRLQGTGPGGAPPKELAYTINPSPVEDLNAFGTNIAGMCQGLPTYVAEEIPGENLPSYSQKCYTTRILFILNISFCKTTVEQS